MKRESEYIMTRVINGIEEWLRRVTSPGCRIRQQAERSQPGAEQCTRLDGQMLLPGIAEPHRWNTRKD